MEEVKEVFFILKGSSSSGPDGLTGNFFQVCLEVVKQDVLQVITTFIAGDTLPKSFTHTNLVLIPKKETV